MAIRETLASLLGGSPTSDLDIQRMVDEAVAARGGEGANTEALDAEIASLKKKLNMAMGAVQAATAQLMALKKDLAATQAIAQQATQHATTAKATAEAAADGLTGVEARLDSLVEKLGSAPPAPAKKKSPKAPKKKAPKTPPPEHCTIEGCGNKHRARGLCAKHYQQMKRGTL